MAISSIIEQRCKELQAEIVRRKMTLIQVGEIADVPSSTLASIKKPYWNPRLKTLVAVEKGFARLAASEKRKANG